MSTPNPWKLFGWLVNLVAVTTIGVSMTLGKALYGEVKELRHDVDIVMVKMEMPKDVPVWFVNKVDDMDKKVTSNTKSTIETSVKVDNIVKMLENLTSKVDKHIAEQKQFREAFNPNQKRSP